MASRGWSARSQRSQQPLPRSILFVCTGNQCRSPAAAAIMRHLLGQKGLAIEVDSAGTGPYRDVPAYHLVVEAVAGLGIDLSRHRSKPVDARLLERADLILAMAPEHVRWLRSARPDLAGRIRLLRPYCLGLEDPAADEDPAHQIPDPIGLPARAHQECVATLRSLLERLVARWSP